MHDLLSKRQEKYSNDEELKAETPSQVQTEGYEPDAQNVAQKDVRRRKGPEKRLRHDYAGLKRGEKEAEKEEKRERANGGARVV